MDKKYIILYPSENYDDYTQKGFSDKYKINN